MAREKPRGVQLRRDTLEVTPLQWAYLTGEWSPGQPVPEGTSPVEQFAWGQDALLSIEDAWEQCRDMILGGWIRSRPGTRPWPWWVYDAPRWEDDPWEGCYWHGTFPIPRERLGGKGTPSWEALNYVPSFECGLPDSWISRTQLDSYETHGKHGGLRNCEHPDRPVEAFDPKDPPMYESQAAYLKRLGLLFEGEEVALSEEDFAPVSVRSPEVAV